MGGRATTKLLQCGGTREKEKLVLFPLPLPTPPLQLLPNVFRGKKRGREGSKGVALNTTTLPLSLLSPFHPLRPRSPKGKEEERREEGGGKGKRGVRRRGVVVASFLPLSPPPSPPQSRTGVRRGYQDPKAKGRRGLFFSSLFPDKGKWLIKLFFCVVCCASKSRALILRRKREREKRKLRLDPRAAV